MLDRFRPLLLAFAPFVLAVRRPLGLFCLGIGLTGAILPILPGWPFLLIGTRLLGRRDPAVRRMLVLVRRALRWLRTARQPLLRRLGAWLTPSWQQFTHLLTG